MQFFVDEAGSFAVPATRRHAVGTAVGIAITEDTWPQLVADYREFREGLPSSSFSKGELKGRLMTATDLDRFAELFGRHDGLTLAPVTMDLGHLSGKSPKELLGTFHARLDLTAASMIYPEARAQMQVLSKQVQNLSLPQVLRIQTWSRCLYETLFHAILFLAHGPYAKFWENVRIEIDPVQPHGSREELVLRVMLYAWMTAWTVKQPFATMKEIHTMDHPFVRNFTSDDGVVLSELIRPNLHWPSSADSEGLQMADIAASIVYQAALELNDSNGAVTRFYRLMASSAYGHARGPGLISPLPATTEDVAGPYSILFEDRPRR